MKLLKLYIILQFLHQYVFRIYVVPKLLYLFYFICILIERYYISHILPYKILQVLQLLTLLITVHPPMALINMSLT
jgi:hypothetical protein